MWARGDLASWADVDEIIERHVPHPTVEEGFEAMAWERGGADDPEDGDDSEDGADIDDGDDPDGGGLGGPGGASASSGLGGAASASSGQPSGSAAGSDDPSGSAAISGGDGGQLSGAPAAGSGGELGGHPPADDPAYLEALRLVAAVSARSRNNALLRPVLKELRHTSLKRSAAEAPQAEALRAAAREEQQRAQAAREERRKLERQAKIQDIAAMTALEEAKQKAASARQAAIAASSQARREEEIRLEASACARRPSLWLQTVFPVALARKLLEWRRGLEPADVKALRLKIDGLLDTQRCTRRVVVPELWQRDKALSRASCYVCLPGQGAKRTPVRRARDFEWALFGQGWAAESHSTDAALALAQLLYRICPHGSYPFRRRHTMHHLLEASECVADQAFVPAVVLLSKWLGEDLFPRGIYNWPPDPPASVTAPSVSASASASSASATAGLG